MSVWSHVAMVFRIDSLMCLGEDELDFEKIFGQSYSIYDEEDVYDESKPLLPMGSEGSLKMSVWTNPDPSSAASYTVTIFGDLRDHEDVDGLIEWFETKCKSMWIRQAVITVDNDLIGTVTKTYRMENNL